jgi:hypothetical protein
LVAAGFDPSVARKEAIQAKQRDALKIDNSRSMWRIPAERMKMSAEHLVALSTRALAVLEDLNSVSGAWPQGFRFSFRLISGQSFTEPSLKAQDQHPATFLRRVIGRLPLGRLLVSPQLEGYFQVWARIRGPRRRNDR